MANLVEGIRRARSEIERRQFVLLLAASILACLSEVVYLVGVWSGAPSLVARTALLWLAVLPLGYGVANYSAIVEGRTIRRHFISSLIAVSLVTLLYFVVSYLSSVSFGVRTAAFAFVILLAVVTHSLAGNARAVLDYFFVDPETRRVLRAIRMTPNNLAGEGRLDERLALALDALCTELRASYGLVLLLSEGTVRLAAAYHWSHGKDLSISPEALVADDIALLEPDKFAWPLEGAALLAPLYLDTEHVGGVLLGHPVNATRYAAADAELAGYATDHMAEMIRIKRLEAEAVERIVFVQQPANPVGEPSLEAVETALRRMNDFVYLGTCPLSTPGGRDHPPPGEGHACRSREGDTPRASRSHRAPPPGRPEADADLATRVASLHDLARGVCHGPAEPRRHGRAVHLGRHVQPATARGDRGGEAHAAGGGGGGERAEFQVDRPTRTTDVIPRSAPGPGGLFRPIVLLLLRALRGASLSARQTAGLAVSCGPLPSPCGFTRPIVLAYGEHWAGPDGRPVAAPPDISRKEAPPMSGTAPPANAGATEEAKWEPLRRQLQAPESTERLAALDELRKIGTGASSILPQALKNGWRSVIPSTKYATAARAVLENPGHRKTYQSMTALSSQERQVVLQEIRTWSDSWAGPVGPGRDHWTSLQLRRSSPAHRNDCSRKPPPAVRPEPAAALTPAPTPAPSPRPSLTQSLVEPDEHQHHPVSRRLLRHRCRPGPLPLWSNRARLPILAAVTGVFGVASFSGRRSGCPGRRSCSSSYSLRSC